MSKMCTERAHLALNGPTMGTRWSALIPAEPGRDPGPIRAALQAAVDEVEAQMSLWRPDSDLSRLRAAPAGVPVALPEQLCRVLELGLAIGRASGGAFDIGLGDAVRAWGFGPDPLTPEAIRAARAAPRRPAHELLRIEAGHLWAAAPVALDLNGIAKGHGVDRLAEVVQAMGIRRALVGIDGEMRALGRRADNRGWNIAIEAPDPDRRAPLAILTLEDAAVATSGDYRHYVALGGQRLAHTMDPGRAAPLTGGPASVTVVARGCAEADAWATALMVLGPGAGGALARRMGLSALFVLRTDAGLRRIGIGPMFAQDSPPPA